MATNKHAYIRYKTLDSCFRNNHINYDFKKLLDEVNTALSQYDSNTNGIGRSILYEDINFIESNISDANVELRRIKKGKQIFYSYSDPNFSLFNMPLSEVELNHLKEATKLLAKFKGMPQFKWVEELIPKLQQGIFHEKEKPILSFDSNDYLKGIEFLGALYSAILYSKTLFVTYQDFKSPEPYEIEIFPYYLKQYNNRWFLFCFSNNNERLFWNLALDRIKGIKESETKYVPNHDIDWEEYFEDIVGVTKPENAEVEQVELLFIPQTAQYVITKPIHQSQAKLFNNENGLLIRLNVIVNMELISLILSFGERVKVIKPDSLKKKIQFCLTESLVSYNSSA